MLRETPFDALSGFLLKNHKSVELKCSHPSPIGLRTTKYHYILGRYIIFYIPGDYFEIEYTLFKKKYK